MPREAVHILIIGMNGNERAHIEKLDTAREQITQECTGWLVLPLMVPAFDAGLLLLRDFDSIKLVHFINQTSMTYVACAEGCEKLARTMAKYRPDLPINFGDARLYCFERVFRQASVQISEKRLEDAVYDRWRDTAPIVQIG